MLSSSLRTASPASLQSAEPRAPVRERRQRPAAPYPVGDNRHAEPARSFGRCLCQAIGTTKESLPLLLPEDERLKGNRRCHTPMSGASANRRRSPYPRAAAARPAACRTTAPVVFGRRGCAETRDTDGAPLSEVSRVTTPDLLMCPDRTRTAFNAARFLASHSLARAAPPHSVARYARRLMSVPMGSVFTDSSVGRGARLKTKR